MIDVVPGDLALDLRILTFKKTGEGKWRRQFMNREKQLERGARNPHNIWYTWRGVDKNLEPEVVLEAIKTNLEKECMLGCIIYGHSSSAEEARGSGLYKKHYYSILRACEDRVVFMFSRPNTWGILRHKVGRCFGFPFETKL